MAMTIKIRNLVAKLANYPLGPTPSTSSLRPIFRRERNHLARNVAVVHVGAVATAVTPKTAIEARTKEAPDQRRKAEYLGVATKMWPPLTLLG